MREVRIYLPELTAWTVELVNMIIIFIEGLPYVRCSAKHCRFLLCPRYSGSSLQRQDRMRSWGAKFKEVFVLPNASSRARCPVNPVPDAQ